MMSAGNTTIMWNTTIIWNTIIIWIIWYEENVFKSWKQTKTNMKYVIHGWLYWKHKWFNANKQTIQFWIEFKWIDAVMLC